MAQNLAPKQLNFCRAFATAVVALLDANDNLTALVNDWNANAFATGASPTGNNITDTVISGNSLIQDVAYITAADLNTAEGAVVAVQTTVAAQRGYLEAMRP